MSLSRALCCAAWLLSAEPAVGQDALWHARNLGKAFYENPTTQKEAVEQFKKALALAPQSARERVNYGLALLKAGEIPAALAQLQQAQKQDPTIPHTWFNLGLIYKRDGDSERAEKQMREMVRLVPGEATAHYQLGTIEKLLGHAPEAVGEFEAAERLSPNLAAPHFQLYTAYRQLNRPEDAARALAAFQEAKKRSEGAAVPENMEANNYTEIYDVLEPNSRNVEETKFSDRTLAASQDGLAIWGTKLISWNRDSARLFENGREQPLTLGFDAHGIIAIVPGDFDNDGQIDLCVVSENEAALYRYDAAKLVHSPAKLPPGRFRSALWIDYDHDYDLDLVLLGETTVLLRNNGDGTFTDRTASLPFAKGKAQSAALTAVRPETPARDFVITYADRPPVLYRDLLNGKFEASPIANAPSGGIAAAGDWNRDSFFDLALLSPSGMLYLENHQGRLEPAEPVASSSITASFALRQWVRSNLPPSRDAVSIGGDVAAVLADGSLHWFTRASAPTSKSVRIQITGIKNVKSANGAVVEVKAGALYARQIYAGTPLFFALENHPDADTVRITWPNGLIQNEPHQAAGRSYSYPEAQRLSGSCPMIFTWNGERFEFITDVLGVAPLGALAGEGQYFPVNHVEHILIPEDSLRLENGAYRIRITEELREVSYLDQVKLIALDHPRGEEIFVSDKFTSPPFPEFRLFGAARRIYPLSARDDRGNDILPALLHHDRVYPQFARDLDGVAQTHAVELDFGEAAPDGRAVLLLHGWVDWADGSTFFGAGQRTGGGLVLPYLQVQDASGQWKTVIEDMGMPAGKPKTIAVDLTGRFLSASRRVRVVTSACVYWDEIFLSEGNAKPATRATEIAPASADLHFRGFSSATIDPKREQPEGFLYQPSSPMSQWNPTPGLYTRYGDVRDLLRAEDDRLLIMGSGDEVSLTFPAGDLPAIPNGWRRDFLLVVDGWAKDADANTAFSQTVEPLPFHAMSAYPYRPEEHFPDDAEHREYRRQYLTRPALRLLRPLVDGSAP